MKSLKSKLLKLSVVIFLAMTLNARAYLDHWNSGTGGKPSRNGLAWERGPTNTALLWQGGSYSQNGVPMVMEGNLVVMSRLNFASFSISDVQNGAVIVAQNLTNGVILWTNSLPVDFPATDWFSAVVAMRDKRVFAMRAGNANSSYLYALNAQSGQILWRSQDQVDIYGNESPSFAPNGDLIVGNWASLKRINATNGLTIWSSARTTPTSGGGEPAVYGDRIYIWESSGTGPKISAFNLNTGARLYSSQGFGGGNQQIAPFVGPDGTVYAPRSQGTVQTDYMIALKDTGSAFVEKWRVPLSYVPFASFAVGPDGSVYSYSTDYRVIRIRPQDGVIINSSDVMPSDFYQPRMVVDSAGTVFVSKGGFDQGAIFSYNPDLTLRWTDSVHYINLGGPVIGKNGTLVVAGDGNTIRAYRGNSENQPGPPIHLERGGTNLVVSYSGVLESKDQMLGVWSDVAWAATPWIVTTNRMQQFFRSRQE